MVYDRYGANLAPIGYVTQTASVPMQEPPHIPLHRVLRNMPGTAANPIKYFNRYVTEYGKDFILSIGTFKFRNEIYIISSGSGNVLDIWSLENILKEKIKSMHFLILKNTCFFICFLKTL